MVTTKCIYPYYEGYLYAGVFFFSRLFLPLWKINIPKYIYFMLSIQQIHLQIHDMYLI